MFARNFAVAFSLLAASAFAVTPAIIPLPQQLQIRPGLFTLCPAQPIPGAPARALMTILVDGASQESGQYLAMLLFKSTGYQFPIATSSSGAPAIKRAILLTTVNANTNLGAEGYELTVAPDSVVVRAPASAGVFYGIQSLLQLLPPQVLSPRPVQGVAWACPCVYIQDQPRFSWRGVMLDVARHFFNKDEVKQLLDAMALHKLNTLHLHLCDDHAWRLQIAGYPNLTAAAQAGVAAGAWRNGIDYGLNPRASSAFDPSSSQYGGYYTQDDARSIVAYAAQRHITVVPEIEMPAHCSACLAAYPQLSCGHSSSDYPLDYPVLADLSVGGLNYNADVLSVGTAATMSFLTNVLSQVMSIFPSHYIHCGGDELVMLGSTSTCAAAWKFTSPENDNDWNTYSADTNNMIANGIVPGTYINNNILPEYLSCTALANNQPVYPCASSCCGDIAVAQYQHWFSSTIASFLLARGRMMMGWTEFEYGGLVPNAALMDWEPVGGGAFAAQAAQAGLPVVTAPSSLCYFNNLEATAAVEPPYPGNGTIPLSSVYGFNPVPCGLSGAASANILGAECDLWAEYIPSFKNAMFKLFPRGAALAEVTWTPAVQQNYSSFLSRLSAQEQRYSQMGLNYDHETIPQIGSWANVPSSPTTYSWDISPNVTAAGEIDINFWWTNGSNLSISSVALLVNGNQVDIDNHAFTTLTQGFTLPAAAGSSITLPVASSAWASVGQPFRVSGQLSVGGAGAATFSITTFPSPQTVPPGGTPLTCTWLAAPGDSPAGSVFVSPPTLSCAAIGFATPSSAYPSAPRIAQYTLYVLHLNNYIRGATYTIKAVLSDSVGTSAGIIYMPNWN